VVLASEPYDPDPGWRAVPEGGLVAVTASGVDITRLPTGTRPINEGAV
jgi:glutamine amidotransferase